jgi:hypothetical protein
MNLNWRAIVHAITAQLVLNSTVFVGSATTD